GLTIIVHEGNPLHRISFTELNGIYSRRVTSWNQLAEWQQSGGGKEPVPIAPVRRKEPSGTLDFFKERIRPEGNAMGDVLVIPAFVGSTELAAAVGANPGGIGFVGQSYAKGTGIKRLQIYDDTPQSGMKPDEAVYPDTVAIQLESYPLSRYVFLY